MNHRTSVLMLALTSLILTACGGTGSSGAVPSDPVTPGTIKGMVLDERGAPVAGAKIIIEPAMFRGTVFATTNADGQYHLVQLPRETNPYYVWAYKELTYHGKKYCVRMAGQDHAYQDAINATPGVIRDFRWKLTGLSDMPSDDIGSGHWGASLAFHNSSEDEMFVDAQARIEVRLVPDGPLIDGSEGKPMTRITTVSAGLEDIPAGRYRLSAAVLDADGGKTPLKVGTSNVTSELADSTMVLFDGYDTCGHSGTFLTTFIWLAQR